MAQRGAVARLRHLVTAVGAAKQEVMCTCGCGEVAKECGCPSAVAAIAAAGSSAEPAVQHIVDYDVEALEATTMFNTEEGGDPNAPLTEEQISHFLVEGYIPLPGILDADHIELLKNDVDQVTLDRADAHANKLPQPNNVSYEHMGKLCSHPPTVNKVKQLMRECYAPEACARGGLAPSSSSSVPGAAAVGPDSFPGKENHWIIPESFEYSLTDNPLRRTFVPGPEEP